MTTEQIKSNDHISDDELLKDILDIQIEIDQYEKELDAFRKNPVDNKVSIYMREGRILQRKEFISSLNEILEYRNKK